MRPIILLAAAAILSVTGTAPADAANALQRCVWSCLAGSGKGNAASKAYERCVETRCNNLGEGTTSGQKPDPRLTWISGQTQSGMRFAGVDGRKANTGLYYFCGRGQSFLRVIGIDGGERGMIIDVDGKQFHMRFEPNRRNQPETRVPGHAPVIQALQSGSRVKVLGYEIGAIVDATLSGSSKALAGAVSGC